jgi:hypothetical protein
MRTSEEKAMKVRSVIIDSLNLEFMDSDVGKLSTFVEKVAAQKRNPIVLINEHGDELLRKVPRLLDCDLVYTQKSPRKYEGLFSGLEGAGTCAFYLPLDADYGEENTWLDLEKFLIQLPYLNNTHILIPKGDGPWLVTPAGTLYLKSKDDEYDLDKDKDLNKLQIST